MGYPPRPPYAPPEPPPKRTGLRVLVALAVVVAVLFAGVAAAAIAGIGPFGRTGVLGKPDAKPKPKPPVWEKPLANAPAVLDGAGTSRAAKLPTKQGLAKALAAHVGSGALGPHGGVSVRDALTGKLLYAKDGGGDYTPASTTKLLSSAAALSKLGPSHRFTTKVVRGSAKDQIVLVGGGDPLLMTEKSWATRDNAKRDRRFPTPATIDELAERTAGGLKNPKQVKLVIDDSLFGEPVSPNWRSVYISSGVVARVNALAVNSSKLNWPYENPRSQDPALNTADEFIDALKRYGVQVSGTTRGKAPSGAEPIAAVQSPPLADIVEQVMLMSDNDGAEVIARQVAVASGRPATFAEAGKAVTAELRKLGLNTSNVKLYDGSGLARDNRIPPDVLTQLVSIAAQPDHPELRAVLTGLPVAGYSGSLAERYTRAWPGSSDGAGIVRAKTGTLSGISTLAGTVQTRDGALLAFAVMSDRGAPVDPRIGIDRAAAALAACGCR